MRIGVNVLFLIPGKVGGTETYARGLLSGLENIEASDHFLVFCNRENFPTFQFKSARFKKIICPVQAGFRSFRILWEQLVLPFQLLISNTDLVISLGYTAPLFTFCKSAVVIFDLNWFFHPKEFSFINRLFWKYLVTWSAKRADIVITSSENSRRDIARILKIPQGKIKVIYGGVDRKFFSDNESGREAEMIKKKYGLKNKFIMTASAAYKFKNLGRLVDAFKLLEKGTSGLKLLITGLGGKGGVEVRSKIRQYGLEDRVVVAGWVPNEDLPKLYRAANAYVHPSLYEGFGFPVLEAMSCGCPVVSSRSASLPELVGEAGILINAESVEEIAGGLEKILNQPLRKKLIADGLKRSKQFSWRNAAVRMDKILKSIA